MLKVYSFFEKKKIGCYKKLFFKNGRTILGRVQRKFKTAIRPINHVPECRKYYGATEKVQRRWS